MYAELALPRGVTCPNVILFFVSMIFLQINIFLLLALVYRKITLHLWFLETSVLNIHRSASARPTTEE